jgi:TatD DNase family protein
LRELLVRHAHAAVGEIGLDRWKTDAPWDMQLAAFRLQLELARDLRRPVTIHCIQAWGALADVLRELTPPDGFLLHAYGGPMEMVDLFASLGGYFSFNAYFMHERKAAQREIFSRIPLDRLLVETDAPAMSPPPDWRTHQSVNQDANHPGNIVVTYRALAGLRQMSEAELTAQVGANFRRLFGTCLRET